jgi:eukaryotic-like serine/threonine-protein kinase
MVKPALSPAFNAAFEPGAVVARRYRIEAAIASGGMGTVLRAMHLALGHDVAIKVLHGRILNDDALRRFAREARIAARLAETSPNIARVFDYGAEQSRPFIVMELLRGEDLRERLQRDRRLEPALVVQIVTQLCAALEIAHEAGVTHRDIKPANIFLARGGSARAPELVVKLMDFGVASLADETTLRHGWVLGTPTFMAPEQIAGEVIDHRADLWAVAAVTYGMLTGVNPFGNGTIAQIGTAITFDEPTPATELNPALPEAIDAWMARALAKDPDQRFQNGNALVRSLAEALGTSAPRSPHPALLRQRSGVRRVGQRLPTGTLALLVSALAIACVVVLALLRP